MLALFLGLAATVPTVPAVPQDHNFVGSSSPLPSQMAVNDTAVTAGLADPSSATVGTPINIMATVQNQGDATQTVQVNALANSQFVGAKNVTVAANASLSLSIIWDTSRVAPDVYNITIEAVPLPGEVDLDDNEFQVEDPVELIARGALQVHVSATPRATDVHFTLILHCAPSEGLPPYQYLWDGGDRKTNESAVWPKAYSAPGEYTATCRVTDNRGDTASDSVTVVIAAVPFVVPWADRYFASPGTVIAFRALAMGGTGDIEYTWAFGDGETRTGMQTQYAYDKAGLFTVTLKARDSVGGENEARFLLSIADLEVTVTQSATLVRPGDLVSFTAVAYGGTGGPYSYEWEFGDIHFDTGSRVSHAYTSPGFYTPRITVRDGVNITEVTLEQIVVEGSGTIASGELPYFQLGLGLVGAVAVGVGTVTAVRRRRRRRRWGPRPR